jgi:hypothetical protein
LVWLIRVSCGSRKDSPQLRNMELRTITRAYLACAGVVSGVEANGVRADGDE